MEGPSPNSSPRQTATVAQELEFPKLEQHMEELEHVTNLSFEVLGYAKTLHRRYTGVDNPPDPSPDVRDDSFCAVMECNIERLKQNLSTIHSFILAI